jgi:hypothetical protein
LESIFRYSGAEAGQYGKGCRSLAKRKAGAKKEGAVALKKGQDIEPATATNANFSDLKVQLAHEVAQALWLPGGLGEDEKSRRIKSASAMLDEIKPQDTLEGMLAAQMVATHKAAMECLRRAMLGDQSVGGRDLNLKHATKLLAIYTRQLETLDKHRGKGQQKMTIEHINVEPGGQAIVGNVEAGSGRRRERSADTEPPAIDHSPEMPVNIPDTVATQKVQRKTTKKTRRGQ